MNRKNFVKNFCLSGACICGFNSFLSAIPDVHNIHSSFQQNQTKLLQDYLRKLIYNIDTNLTHEDQKKIFKNLAQMHYENIRMDEVLKPFIGNPEKFIDFLREKGKWNIQYNVDAKVFIADENKDFCVCPLFNKDVRVAGALCYCSEGFTEKMFSTVLQKPVSASVISSIQRGDQRCVYKITVC